MKTAVRPTQEQRILATAVGMVRQQVARTVAQRIDAGELIEIDPNDSAVVALSARCKRETDRIDAERKNGEDHP